MVNKKVGDTFIKDGKTHIVVSVSPSNPAHFASIEVRPDPIAPISQLELLIRICAKLGVSVV